jgi:hypothetical protein
VTAPPRYPIVRSLIVLSFLSLLCLRYDGLILVKFLTAPFAYGRSFAQTITWLVWLWILALLSVVPFLRVRAGLQESLRRWSTFVLAALAVVSTLATIQLTLRLEAPLRDTLNISVSGALTSTAITHSHAFKPVLQSLMVLMGGAVSARSADSGLALEGLVSSEIYLLGAVLLILFVLLLALHYLCLCQVWGRGGVRFWLYGTSTFVLIKTVIDGGIFAPAFGIAVVLWYITVSTSTGPLPTLLSVARSYTRPLLLPFILVLTGGVLGDLSLLDQISTLVLPCFGFMVIYHLGKLTERIQFQHLMALGFSVISTFVLSPWRYADGAVLSSTVEAGQRSILILPKGANDPGETTGLPERVGGIRFVNYLPEEDRSLWQIYALMRVRPGLRFIGPPGVACGESFVTYGAPFHSLGTVSSTGESSYKGVLVPEASVRECAETAWCESYLKFRVDGCIVASVNRAWYAAEILHHLGFEKVVIGPVREFPEDEVRPNP